MILIETDNGDNPLIELHDFSRILSGHARHFYFHEIAADRSLLRKR